MRATSYPDRIYGVLTTATPTCGSRGLSLRQLVAATALSWTLASLGGSANAASEIKKTRDPVIVDVQVGSLQNALAGTAQQRAALVQSMAQKAKQAAQSHPGAVVSLRLADLKLSFDRLSSQTKQQIAQLAGSAELAPAWYESHVADLLTDVLTQARQGETQSKFSVMGLPVEPSARTPLEAQRSNGRYARVIQESDVLVNQRSMIVSNNGEMSALKNALPESFRLADGKAVVFQANNAWKVTTPAEPAEDGSNNSVWPPANSVALLQAAWGTNDPQWDFNGDGVVGSYDLAQLLAIMGEQAGDPGDPPGDPGDDDPPPPPPPPPPPSGPMGQFENAPSSYQLGSGLSISFTLGSSAPADSHVVFQVWSTATDAVEAGYADYDAPFVWPALSLDTAPAGDGELQALIRNSNNQVLATVTQPVTFIAEGGPTTPPDDPPPPPPPPPSDPPTDPPPPPPPPGNPGDPIPWGDPDAPEATPNIQIMDQSGMGPFTVHVHGLNSAVGVGDLLTAEFKWDFGDAGGAYNNLTGWNAAHTYDNPGTYTIQLKITNEAGKTTQTTKQVTVSQDNRQIIYVAANGNDANNGTSQATPIKTWNKMLQLLGNDMKALFRRGDTFDVSGGPDINRKNFVLGAYGTGSKPKLRWTGGMGYGCILAMNEAFVVDAVVQDIDFDSQYPYNSYPERNICDSLRPGGSNITVRNCSFGDVTMAINTEREPQGVYSYNNTTTKPYGLRAYYVWGEGSDQTHVGNVVKGSTHEHNIRMAGVDRFLLAFNDLTEDSKRCIWAMQGEHGYIVGNTLHDGRLAVGPNFAVGDGSERWLWLVIERNMIDKTDASTEAIEIEAGAEHLSIRNNIIKTYGGQSIHIEGWDANMSRTCKDMRILSNTIIEAEQYGQAISVSKGAETLLVANTLYIAPDLVTGDYQSAIMFVNENDLSKFTAIKNNVWAIPSAFNWVGDGYHYVWPTWADAQGYKNQVEWSSYPQTVNDAYQNVTLNSNYMPATNSAATNHAKRVPGVFTDYTGAIRPTNGVWTAGAVQQ